ncbi:hypothetical protein [Spirosoma pulveris]
MLLNRFIDLMLLTGLFLSTSLFTLTFGWNRDTHMVTGAIAYRELQTTSPLIAARLVAILRLV